VTAIGLFPLVAGATAFSVALSIGSASFAGDFEQPPRFSVAQVLPPTLLHSRYYLFLAILLASSKVSTSAISASAFVSRP
jgi:hypothetical protein